MRFVTLKEANDHLRMDLPIPDDWELTDEAEDISDPRALDLEMKLGSAEAIIVDYLKVADESPAWEPTVNDMPIVKAAVLLVLTDLYDDRAGTGDGDYLSPSGAVANLLRRMRDPALA